MSEIKPLILVRAQTVYRVPDVCTAYWSPADWERVSRRICEPLVLVGCGYLWLATGERNERGQLLYRVGEKV